MSKPVLLVLIILLGGGIFALWQNQTERTLRDMPTISAAAVNTEGALVISGTFARSCAASPQAIIRSFANNFDIQLFRERSSLAACGMQAAPFVFELAAESAAGSPWLVINDEVWARETDGQGADASYEAQSLFPVHVDDASLRLDASGDLLLSLRGNQAVGCDLPELFTLREADGRIQIGVYNAMRADVACPDMLVEVKEIIRLPATEAPVDTLFGVNTFLIDGLETENVSDSDKVMTNIFRVNVKVMESQPARISLDIEGEHPDGCDLPIHVEQARDGNTIQVDIYRIVPADMICPMILQPYQGRVQLEGGFEAGSYTIKVNSHSQTLEI